jgi:hypothetical protein
MFVTKSLTQFPGSWPKRWSSRFTRKCLIRVINRKVAETAVL